MPRQHRDSFNFPSNSDPSWSDQVPCAPSSRKRHHQPAQPSLSVTESDANTTRHNKLFKRSPSSTPPGLDAYPAYGFEFYSDSSPEPAPQAPEAVGDRIVSGDGNGGGDAASSNTNSNTSKKRKAGTQGLSAAAPKVRVALPPVPAANASQKMKDYHAKWYCGKPATASTQEEKLRLSFFGQNTGVPRCYTCKVTNRNLTGVPLATGEEEEKLVPCGCRYDEAMLEVWLFHKGLWDKKIIKTRGHPNSLGKHRPAMVSMFEIMHGKFSVDKMLNIGNRRVDGAKESAKAEDRALGPLAPHEIVEDEDDVKASKAQ